MRAGREGKSRDEICLGHNCCIRHKTGGLQQLVVLWVGFLLLALEFHGSSVRFEGRNNLAPSLSRIEKPVLVGATSVESPANLSFMGSALGGI